MLLDRSGGRRLEPADAGLRAARAQPLVQPVGDEREVLLELGGVGGARDGLRRRDGGAAVARARLVELGAQQVGDGGVGALLGGGAGAGVGV